MRTESSLILTCTEERLNKVPLALIILNEIMALLPSGNGAFSLLQEDISKARITK